MEKAHVLNLTEKYSLVFDIPDDLLGHTTKVQHQIFTTDDKPINTKQYRFPLAHRQEIKNLVKELLGENIMQPSQSPFNSPV